MINENRIILTFVFVVIMVLAYLDNFAIIPVISPFAIELGATGFMLGLIVAAYSLSEDVFEVLVGYIIDRVGKLKFLLIFGMLLNALIVFIYSFASSPISLLLVRVGHGMLGALIGPITMTYARFLPTYLKGLGGKMGVYGFAIMISTAIGFPLGGVLTGLYERNFLFEFLATSVLLGGFISIFLPKIPYNNRKPIQFSFKDLLFRGKVLLSDYLILFSLLSIFGLSFVSGGITTLLPYISRSYIEEAEIALSIYLGTTAVVALILQIPIGILADKINKLFLIKVGIINVLIGLIGLILSFNSLTLILSSIPYGVGYAILFPTTASLVLSRVKSEDTGLASGLYHLMFTEGVVWGAVYSGLLYLIINPWNTLLISSAPIFTTLIFLIFLYK